ncbi:hypothetical protein D9615_009374 [Tricholomella constricta]|uniref:Mug135-like C-terminal domain-containing protein n=1 Tax=Tricholomella constricta TaxID=117010 RepID=A0A8H5H2W5_9AGAR|nr:hypothetical protein D9615_009374 [Tricholomella constricta]
MQQLRVDIRNDIRAELVPDFKRLVNHQRGDGTIVPFEIVPFTNGDDPTQPPHNLPRLLSVNSVEDLNGRDLAAYLTGYGKLMPGLGLYTVRHTAMAVHFTACCSDDAQYGNVNALKAVQKLYDGKGPEILDGMAQRPYHGAGRARSARVRVEAILSWIILHTSFDPDCATQPLPEVLNYVPRQVGSMRLKKHLFEDCTGGSTLHRNAPSTETALALQHTPKPHRTIAPQADSAP